jgi:alpha-tubulin suppressor-like RCC1 family protein
MRCWGEGTSGQLGDGLTAHRWIPGPLIGVFATTTWSSFQCGTQYVAAVDSAGKLYTWGIEWFGNLAQGVAAGTIVSTPTLVLGTFPAFAQVAAGDVTICARTTTTRLYCSGSGTYGQTGTGGGGSSTLLTEVIPGATIWRWGPEIRFNTFIAALNAGTPRDIHSWGRNSHGQGGAGNAGTDMLAPTIPTYNPTTFSSYSIGDRHACGINTVGLGDVLCIGDNSSHRSR